MSGSRKRRPRRTKWEKVQDEFRVWSFHVYYEKVFKTEHDHIMRFIKSIVQSSKPMRDTEKVLTWYRDRTKKDVDPDVIAESQAEGRGHAAGL